MQKGIKGKFVFTQTERFSHKDTAQNHRNPDTVKNTVSCSKIRDFHC